MSDIDDDFGMDQYYNDCRYDDALADQWDKGFEAYKEMVLKRIEELLVRYNSTGLIALKFDILEDRL